MRTFVRSTVIAAALVVSITQVAVAGGVIADTSVLQPPPPPGAVCRDDGSQVICQTTFNEYFVDEPSFEVPCGTIYQTSADLRVGLRWYDEDGNLVRRHVFADLEGTWSLSPTGDGPTIAFSGHSNWSDLYLIPGDEDSAVGASRGELTVHLPGGRGSIHIAGIDLGDTHRGVLRPPDDPAVGAVLCDTLGQ